MRKQEAGDLRRKLNELLRKGKLDSACEVLEALLRDPDAAPYDFVLAGDTFAKAEMVERAAVYYRKAVDFYEQEGLCVNGAAVCKKLIRLNLGDAEIHERLGRLYAKEGFAKEAQDSFLACAELRARDGARDGALAALGLASSQSLPQVEPVIRLSELLISAGKKEDAVMTLKLHIEEFEGRGKTAEVRHLRERLAAVEADHAGNNAVLDEEEIEKAVGEYRELLSECVHGSQSHFELGQAFMEMENYADAIEELKLASEDDSVREASLALVERCMERLGEKEDEWF